MRESDDVKSFVNELLGEIQKRNVDKIRKMYEELKYTTLDLPPFDAVTESFGSDHIFCYLYSEMRYRRLSRPTVLDRIDSWYTYRCLLQRLCQAEGLIIRLPYEWLWDLVDHFVNQFKSFCEFRAKETLTEEDMKLLKLNKDGPWGVFYTLCVLLIMVRDSKISQTLNYQLGDKDGAAEYNVSKALGYFAKVGLLRVHCLLGHYQTGLKRLQPINICKPGFYTCLIGSHISTVHHWAFANLMLGSYDEAVCRLNRLLLYLRKTRHLYEKSRDIKQIQDKITQIYALLALCHLGCSQDDLIDTDLKYPLSKRYGDQIRIIQKTIQKTDNIKGNSFCQILHHAWPIFAAPFEPQIGDPRDAFRESLFYRHFPDEKEVELRYPPSRIPFDPDDKEPYISHNQQLGNLIDTLIATNRMSKLN